MYRGVRQAQATVARPVQAQITNTMNFHHPTVDCDPFNRVLTIAGPGKGLEIKNEVTTIAYKGVEKRLMMAKWISPKDSRSERGLKEQEKLKIKFKQWVMQLWEGLTGIEMSALLTNNQDCYIFNTAFLNP